MARGRLISKTLGNSSRKFVALGQTLGKLGEFGQALYPLLVANTDDFGRMDGDAFTVKYSVFSTSPRHEADFEKALAAMASVGLIARYQVEGRMFLQVNDFDAHQPGLHKRRASRFPEPPGNAGNFPEIPSEQEQEQEQEGEREQEGKGKAAVPRPADLLAVWNEHRGELPEASKLTADRERHATSRLREQPDLSIWAAVVKRMAESAFCRGENDRGWRADVDFLLRPGTSAKVLEGKYDDRGRGREPPLTARELANAHEVRRKNLGGRCDHEPTCSDSDECLRLLALHLRHKGAAA